MVDERKKLHRDIVDNFLYAQYAFSNDTTPILSKIKGGAVTRDVTRDDKSGASSIIWSYLRRATIIEFSKLHFGELYKEISRFTTEEIGGEKFTYEDSDSFSGVDSTEPETFYKAVEEAGRRVPFPEKIPFDCCYFAWGEGVPLSEVMARLYNYDAERTRRVKSIGMLVVSDLVAGEVERNVFDLMKGLNSAGETYFMVEPIYASGRWGEPEDDPNTGWLHPFSVYPWLVDAVVRIVNANDTLVKGLKPGLWDRARGKKIKKEYRVSGSAIPRPYYPVELRSSTLTDTVSSTFKGVRKLVEARSYRSMVRGHWMTKYLRGKLPLEAAVRTKLLKRRGSGSRYKIWTAVNPPDTQAMEVLTRHGQRGPQPGEWVATLRSWRRDHVKGPEDAPFVPSTRRLRK
jgi:hypothetical protein